MSATEAARWLAYSLSDLKAARKLLAEPDFYPRHVCFLSQQSAEKALKAALVFAEIEFPFTHDLDRLREAIPADWTVKKTFPQLYGLSIWAVESRYPGDMPDIVIGDAQNALSLAEAIYETVVKDIEHLSKYSGDLHQGS